MDIAVQAKLLRALQEKEIVRVGSNKPLKTNCRIIVATNKNLQESVLNKTFRQDLYYRLFGLPIELPPLRERGNDVVFLAKHFITGFCAENKLPVRTLSKAAVDKLMAYNFPGNIRELKSIIELAITLADDQEISAENIITDSDTLLSDNMEKEMSLREYNIRIVKKYLERYDENIKLVAEKLDIGVATIYRMLKE